MKGIVIKSQGSSYVVKVEEQKILCIAKGVLKFKKMQILVGDSVEVEMETKTITKVYPRKNEFIRPPIANVDQLIIVVASANPSPDLMLLDKQIVMAEKNGVEPIICINKIDLDAEYSDIIETYENIGYQVITTTAKNGIGIDKIARIINNKITAFSGNSGVGKSALTNNIFNEEVTAEGETSERLQRGKHTTKHVELYEFAKNSFIADTPGFSSFDVDGVSAKDLAEYYIEFNNFVSDCEYRSCTHVKELNCGVKKAVSKRKIDKGRYERYVSLYEKLKGDKKW
ncbi:MAG: ribosome small subunit-dependent GTPase A [Clostridia bacterium]|nr:ribosome small subunit-dependent GTPase A [Clostridia bacterium]